tara:strand:- start:72 stop:419 length:348 start_codon:yes stop_codon:yes gene_type:complete
MSGNFEKNIQKWVAVDNQLKIINEKAKELREEKNDLLENINVYIETNKLSNASIDISDGKLKFTQSKITQPLTLKFVETCLTNIINDSRQVTQIMKYIKDKREKKDISEIKRYYK